MSTEICEGMKERLVELLYGEVSSTDRAAVEAHLGGCAACREELSQFQEVRRTLRTVAADVPSSDRSRVIVLGRAPARGLGRWTRLAAAAAVVLLASLSLFNARIAWGPDGATIAFSLIPAGTGPIPEDLREQAQTAARQVLAEVSSQRDLLEASFRHELDRREAERARQLQAALTDLARGLDQQRYEDLQYLMAHLGSLEARTGQEMARTNQLLEFAVLASGPAVGLER